MPLGGTPADLTATDPEGQPLTFTLTTGTLPPGIVLGPDGTFSGTATTPGTYTSTITVTDPLGAAATTTLVITVPAPPANQPPAFGPEATNDAQTVPVGGTPADLTATDPEGQPLTFTLLTGTLPPGTSLGADGTFSGTATTPGTYTVTIAVTDPLGASSTTTLVITVPAPPNAPPTAVDDARTTTTDTPVDVELLGNDTDPDADELTVTAVEDPANGTVVLDAATGVITYTPDAGFTGTDSFDYTITDGNGGTSTATVTITVVAPVPTNQAPAFGPQGSNTAQTVEVGEGVADLAATDPEGQPLTYVQVGGTLPPGVTLNGDGSFSGSPTVPGTYTVVVQVSDPLGASDTTTLVITVPAPPVNGAPDAVDDSGTTPQGAAVGIEVLGNDTDPDGDALTVVSVTQPANGTVSCTAGVCTYLPDPGFTGTDSFTYTVADGNGGTDTATVTVTVTPAPPANVPPVAGDDSGTTPQGVGVNVPVLGNDTDADGGTLTVVSVTQPANGTVSCTAAGVCTYLPDAGFTGTDTFTYTVADGQGGSDTATVTVTVTPAPPANVPPVAGDDSGTTPQGVGVNVPVLGNDTDADGGTLTVVSVTQPANGTVSCTAAGVCTYLPDAGFTGTDTFTYTVADGQGGSDTATVTITVVATPPANSPPLGVDDAATTPAGTPVTVPVLGNDTDPDGDDLTVVAVTQPANGTATCTATGCTYTPDPGFTGTDTFTYTVSDGNGGTDVVTVTVTVTAAPAGNRPPVTQPDTGSTPAGTPLTLPVLGNDSDPDADPLEVVSWTQPENGTVTCTPGGQCTYTPDPGFTGTDTFTYTVSDGNGGTRTETVTVTVTDDGGVEGDGDDRGDGEGPGSGGGAGGGSGSGSDGGSGGRLPYSGSETADLLVVGLLLLLGGAGLVLGGRRRRPARA